MGNRKLSDFEINLNRMYLEANPTSKESILFSQKSILDFFDNEVFDGTRAYDGIMLRKTRTQEFLGLMFHVSFFDLDFTNERFREFSLINFYDLGEIKIISKNSSKIWNRGNPSFFGRPYKRKIQGQNYGLTCPTQFRAEYIYFPKSHSNSYNLLNIVDELGELKVS